MDFKYLLLYNKKYFRSPNSFQKTVTFFSLHHHFFALNLFSINYNLLICEFFKVCLTFHAFCCHFSPFCNLFRHCSIPLFTLNADKSCSSSWRNSWRLHTDCSTQINWAKLSKNANGSWKLTVFALFAFLLCIPFEILRPLYLLSAPCIILLFLLHVLHLKMFSKFLFDCQIWRQQLNSIRVLFASMSDQHYSF